MKLLPAAFIVFLLPVSLYADANPAIQQAGSGNIMLTAANATVNGTPLQLEGDDEQDLGNWSDGTNFPSWVVNVNTTGHYRVELVYSGTTDVPTNVIDINCGSQKVEFQPFPTGDWTHYRRVTVGEVDLNQTGHMDFSVKCAKKGGPYVMNFRKLVLIPAKSGDAAEPMVPVLTDTINGVMTLKPANAGITGTAVAIQPDGTFGSWSSTDTSFTWPVKLAPGNYHLVWTYSLDPSNTGTEIHVEVGSFRTMTLVPDVTADWNTYMEVPMGDVTIDKLAPFAITVKATKQGASFVMNLKQITITPVKSGNP